MALTKQTHIYGYVVNSIYAGSSMNKPCVNLRIGKIEWVDFKYFIWLNLGVAVQIFYCDTCNCSFKRGQIQAVLTEQILRVRSINNACMNT